LRNGQHIRAAQTFQFKHPKLKICNSDPLQFSNYSKQVETNREQSYLSSNLLGGALPIQTLVRSSISKATAKRSQSSQAHIKLVPYQKYFKNTKLNTLLVLTLQRKTLDPIQDILK
jgi:hypothetical protein